MLTQENVKALFIVRDDRLHWRDTGVLAGYLTTACREGRRVELYPWVMIPNGHFSDTISVHRLMRLHENGELPTEGMEVAHLNSIRTDNNRWNLKTLSKSDHRKMDAATCKRLKLLGVYHRQKHKPHGLDPSDERVRGVAVKLAEHREWSWIALQVRKRYIMRNDRLYSMATGVEVGYLSVPMDYREKQKRYSEVKVEGVNIKVHRLVWLYVHGDLPDKRDPPHLVINHIDENKWNNNRWNLEKVSNRDNILKSTAHQEFTKKHMENMRRTETGLFDPEAKKKAHESTRRNKTGCFLDPVLRGKVLENARDSQRRNGQGFHNPEQQKRMAEKRHRNGHSFGNPELQKKAQAVVKENNRIMRWKRMRKDFADARATGDIKEIEKTVKKWKKTSSDREYFRLRHQAKMRGETYSLSRRNRWAKFRAEFEEARSTGDIQEVMKVVAKWERNRRLREYSRQYKAKKKKAKLESLVS